VPVAVVFVAAVLFVVAVVFLSIKNGTPTEAAAAIKSAMLKLELSATSSALTLALLAASATAITPSAVLPNIN
jgi:hypothetical protein